MKRKISKFQTLLVMLCNSTCLLKWVFLSGETNLLLSFLVKLLKCKSGKKVRHSLDRPRIRVFNDVPLFYNQSPARFWLHFITENRPLPLIKVFVFSDPISFPFVCCNVQEMWFPTSLVSFPNLKKFTFQCRKD